MLSISSYLDRLSTKISGTELEQDLLPLQAIDAINHGNWALAEHSLSRIDSPDSEIYSYRALCAMAVKDLEEAKRLLELALQLPDSDKTQLLLLQYGEVLATSGDLNSAADIYEKAIEENPNSLKPYVRLVQTLINLEKLSRARTILEVAFTVEERPDYQTELWNLKGCIEGKFNELNQAAISFATAVSCDNQNYDAWFNLAITLTHLGRKEEADLALSRIPAEIIARHIGNPSSEQVEEALEYWKSEEPLKNNSTDAA